MANHGNKIRKSGNHPPCFTETKSRKILKILIWERHRPWFTETKSRQKYWVPGHNFFLWNFGNVTERVLRKQNPDHHFWKWNLLERILWIMMTNLFSTVINDWVRVRLFQLNSVIRYESLHMVNMVWAILAAPQPHFYLIFFNWINTALVQNKSLKTFWNFLSGFCFQKSRSVTYPK